VNSVDSAYSIAVSCKSVGVQEVIGVIIGGTLGHALCTSLAVLGGRCISQHISIKTGRSHYPVISSSSHLPLCLGPLICRKL